MGPNERPCRRLFAVLCLPILRPKRDENKNKKISRTTFKSISYENQKRCALREGVKSRHLLVPVITKQLIVSVPPADFFCLKQNELHARHSFFAKCRICLHNDSLFLYRVGSIKLYICIFYLI